MFKLTSGGIIILAVAATTPALAADRGHGHTIKIELSGAQEDPTVITDGRGDAVLRIQGSTVA